MHHPIPIEELPEAAQKPLKGPAPLKMMAARGMAPLPPPVLVTVLYALAWDTDDKLADAARTTLGKLPPPILDGALNSQDLHPAVLDDLSARLRSRRDVQERIIQHARTDGETIVHLAGTADEALCELIATNEQRLLSHPKIIEALYFNRNVRMSTADRIVELAARNGVELNIPSFKDIVAALQNQLIPEAGEENPADDMFREALEEAEDIERGATEDEDVVDRDEEGEEKLKDKYKKVDVSLDKMNMSEKIRAALIGTAGQRAILVRSAARPVAMAAVSSPKVQESEAAKWSASRSVSEDVLRFIAGKRDWIRMHTIKVNLCFNPKTPVSTSLRLVPHLREQDLKAIMRSRNVPSSLKTAVNQLLQKRENKH